MGSIDGAKQLNVGSNQNQCFIFSEFDLVVRTDFGAFRGA